MSAERLYIHKTYRLMFDGAASPGVRGSSTLLLNAAGSGDQGTNYQALITWRTLAGPVAGFAAKNKVAAAKPATQAGAPTRAGFDALAAAGELGTVADLKWGKTATV